MKHAFLYSSLLLIFSTSYCNSQCLVNGNFLNYCGTQTGGDCPTFNHPCLDNWWRSHGTPQIKTGVNSEGNFPYAFLWASVVNVTLIGEGLFASYSFLANHSYTITLTVQATSSIGSILVYAANGLTEPSSYNCGDPIPVLASEQLITQQSPNVGAGYVQYILNFVANANYNQLWIYPSTSSALQYNINVSYIDACLNECEGGYIVYNGGAIPAGTSESGDIYAGSSTGIGGAGTVTVSSTAATTLKAANAVHFEPEFRATVTTGSFSAKIITCSGLQGLPVQNNNINKFSDEGYRVITPANIFTDSLSWLKAINNREQTPDKNIITISPVPTKALITISSSAGELTNAEITIYDQIGNEVYRVLNKFSGSDLDLNLSHLDNGLYFIKVKTQEQIIGKKIIINK